MDSSDKPVGAVFSLLDMDDPTVAVRSLSISWCQSHIRSLHQSMHCRAPRRRGSTSPRARVCFPSWNMKLSAGGRTVGREYIFDNVESLSNPKSLKITIGVQWIPKGCRFPKLNDQWRSGYQGGRREVRGLWAQRRMQVSKKIAPPPISLLMVYRCLV